MLEEPSYETIKKLMDNKELADEMEKVSPGIKAKMAGHLLSPWLPHGWGRKIVMIIIAFVAIVGSFSNQWFLLLLLLLPLFSPRAVGEIIAFFGGSSK